MRLVRLLRPGDPVHLAQVRRVGRSEPSRRRLGTGEAEAPYCGWTKSCTKLNPLENQCLLVFTGESSFLGGQEFVHPQCFHGGFLGGQDFVYPQYFPWFINAPEGAGLARSGAAWIDPLSCKTRPLSGEVSWGVSGKSNWLLWREVLPRADHSGCFC